MRLNARTVNLSDFLVNIANTSLRLYVCDRLNISARSESFVAQVAPQVAGGQIHEPRANVFIEELLPGLQAI
jgi:hypothetical protein